MYETKLFERRGTVLRIAVNIHLPRIEIYHVRKITFEIMMIC
jgi:hypothetical protein